MFKACLHLAQAVPQLVAIKWPEAQLEHDADPLKAANFPGGHATHSDDPLLEKKPAVHNTQLLDPLLD